MQVQVAMLCNICRTLLVSLSLSAVVTAAIPRTSQAHPHPTNDIDVFAFFRSSEKLSLLDDYHGILTEHSANIVEKSIEAILQARHPYQPSLCPGLPRDTQGFQVGNNCWVLHFGMLPLLISKLFLLQVAVAVMKWMELRQGRSKAEKARLIAKSLHRMWGMESPDCDNRVVLFVSQDDNEV